MRPKNVFYGFLVIAIILVVSVVVFASREQRHDQIKPVPRALIMSSALANYTKFYNKSVAGDCAMGTDGMGAKIAWMRSFCENSLLDAYLATQETNYLKTFVRNADDIWDLRDDHRNPPLGGGTSHGWTVAHHYSLSYPLVLADAGGHPSLQISGVARSANQATHVTINNEGDGRFKLTIENRWKYGKPRSEVYNHLSLKTVAMQVNSGVHASKLVSVKVLGAGPPASAGPYQLRPVPFVFETHHAGTTLAPLLRFAMLCRQGKIATGCAVKSEAYVRQARQTMADYEAQWVDLGDSGFYRIKKGIPYWCDGAPEPINAMSEQGLAFLYLWEATGDKMALVRVQKIINFIRGYVKYTSSGTPYWPYWDGEAYTGWTAADNVSTNTPDFPPYKWTDTTHYAQYTIRFLSEAYEAHVSVTRKEIDGLVRQFWLVWQGLPERSGKKGYLSTSIDGKGDATGRDDIDIYGFIHLARYDPRILDAIAEVYHASFDNPEAFASEHRNGLAIATAGWAAIAHAAGYGAVRR